MDDSQKSRIYELLKLGLEKIESGEDPPLEWVREIADMAPPERRECELVYDGKEKEEKIIAETMAVPFQEVSTFGEGNQDDLWRNMLIFGDNLQAMKQLLRMKEEGKLVNADGTPGVRLVYIDPPFATKRDFEGSQEQKAYQDKIVGAKFIDFLRKRLILLRELLSDNGSIFVHLDQKKGHYIKVILDEIFGEHNFKNEVVWQRTSAHNDAGKFGNNADFIFYYTKSNNYLWNQLYTAYDKEYLARFKYTDPDGRKWQDGPLTAKGLSGGGYEYTYKGIKGLWRCPISTMEKLDQEGLLYITKKGGIRIKRYLDMENGGIPLQAIWSDIHAVNSQAIERIGFPTQKPETLAERIIRVSSNPGDIVLDAFAGSGTTLAVAEKLNRRWIGIDSSKFAIYTIQKRLLELRSEIGNKGKPITPKAFTLYNAGLYDFDKLKTLPWEDWRFFALQLFGCKDEPHAIKGFKMDGRRQGASVYVFNHFGGKQIDYETIGQIHVAIGDAVGDKCFIIAPKGSFLFQEDYVSHGHVRYYALRIPYSFIHELHRREFSALIQPKDEKSINAAIDVVGFDFIQAPEVEIKTTKDSHAIRIQIEKFETRARIRGEEKQSGFEALSMVLADLDYNDRVFNPDQAFYAKDLVNRQWTMEFLLDQCKNVIMLVILDIYGNESRIRLEINTLREDLPCQNQKPIHLV